MVSWPLGAETQAMLAHTEGGIICVPFEIMCPDRPRPCFHVKGHIGFCVDADGALLAGHSPTVRA